eukprot:scaffold224251_cov27-Tisochrysis_lutea.AAC.1
MALVLLALAAFPDCPDQPDGCGGTAVERAAESRRRAREVDLDRPWQDVRDSLVRACGLLVGQSTSHCFDDFNHVACCAMAASQHHNTNEESRVVGMHTVNYLGEHIIAASDPELGEGGSWCTCQLSAPYDVCHRQFGARTAWTLLWCEGSGIATLVDDDANVLASGKPFVLGSEMPRYGGRRARRQAWNVIVSSRNTTWSSRFRAACDNNKSSLLSGSESVADGATDVPTRNTENGKLATDRMAPTASEDHHDEL